MFAGQVSTGAGIEFDCLTAALLGGVSFMGGEGSIFGLITGVLIIGVLNNAMQLASFPDFSQNVVKGVVLLAAVGFDTYQKNRQSQGNDPPGRWRMNRDRAMKRSMQHDDTLPGGMPVTDRRPGRHRSHQAQVHRPPVRAALRGATAGSVPARRGRTGPSPVILSIHGGAFMGCDKGDVQVLPMLEGLKRGYAVAAVNYRLSGEAKFPALLQDLKAAVRWLRGHAVEYGLDAALDRGLGRLGRRLAGDDGGRDGRRARAGGPEPGERGAELARCRRWWPGSGRRTF